jgi:chromosome segregation ATPase
MTRWSSITSTAQIPDEPPHTCPMIDSVIGILEEQFKSTDGSIDLMERIRQNCSALRCWGESWKEYAEYCEENSNHYETKYDQAEEENSDNADEIIQLQKKIDELESKISDLEFDLKYNYKKIEE